ncbi:hypothetical protein M422DRAFT_35562 [Sphaerobolus stellatus SS14]|uniref:Uncharacterized protein n=1 Tax=Sphaerobolus stellatus (strain SS14) TaxID=990650 RepID=A0A0C9UV98_SPHS4|nr:hypothetical protein M422DRAFT_35562 [Sphaerobolus stellatus SS14]
MAFTSKSSNDSHAPPHSGYSSNANTPPFPEGPPSFHANNSRGHSRSSPPRFLDLSGTRGLTECSALSPLSGKRKFEGQAGQEYENQGHTARNPRSAAMSQKCLRHYYA